MTVESREEYEPTSEEEPVSETYVTWYEGSVNTNIVISVPHDGRWKPDFIPDRIKINNQVSINADTRAADLASVLRDELARELGATPHMIVSNLHRVKLDPNRVIDLAAQSNKDAEEAYHEFHGYIEKAHAQVRKVGIPGLHFDIHGYRYGYYSTDNIIEISYNIHRDDLNTDILDPNTSSIKSLATRHNHVTFESLVRGEESLGALVQSVGYKAMLSPDYPYPKLREGNKYMRGGYITRKWGSLHGGDIDCIQLEFPEFIRDESREHGPVIGRAMAAYIRDKYLTVRNTVQQ